MDIISHGLWGGILFGRSSKKDFWLAFMWGILPDLLVFGVPFALRIIQSLSGHGDRGFGGRPEASDMPSYLYDGYQITHSLVIFAVTFAVVWIIRKKPVLVMLGWPAHILLDMPVHTTEFFPTPFLWPFTHPLIDGISWGHPTIILPNFIFLAVLYIWFYMIRPRWRKKKAAEILSRSGQNVDKMN